VSGGAAAAVNLVIWLSGYLVIWLFGYLVIGRQVPNNQITR
jgi:hypothetical protein